MSEYCVRVGIARSKVFVLKKNHPMKRRNHGGCEWGARGFIVGHLVPFTMGVGTFSEPGMEFG